MRIFRISVNVISFNRTVDFLNHARITIWTKTHHADMSLGPPKSPSHFKSFSRHTVFRKHKLVSEAKIWDCRDIGDKMLVTVPSSAWSRSHKCFGLQRAKNESQNTFNILMEHLKKQFWFSVVVMVTPWLSYT